MIDTNDPANATGAGVNWVKITNVLPGDCIGLTTGVQVSYGNVNLVAAAVGVSCPGAGAPPDQAVGIGTGSLTFKLIHGAPGAGHGVGAVLKDRGARVASDSVSPVNVGNPCPIKIANTTGIVDGLYALDPTRPLSGTFDLARGDGIVLLVEQPAKAEGPNVPAPLLVFAAPAAVDTSGKEGTWTYPVIKEAKKGQQLRVVLTRDGVVRSTVRAVFD